MSHDLIQRSRPELIGLAKLAWLDSKFRRSQSSATRLAYEATFDSFASALEAHGLAIDDGGQVAAIRLALQEWAGRPVQRGGTTRPPAESTYNHRLAVVASFYEYAIRHELFNMANPADRVERAVVQNYGDSQAIDPAEVAVRLAEIDRSTLPGLRDFAILTVGLSTGRRSAEIAGLTWADVAVQGRITTLHFRHCKGGKKATDRLNARASALLLAYLEAAKVALAEEWSDAKPIWIGFSPRDPLAPAGTKAIAGVVRKHLGEQYTPHTMRHTFALMMDMAGAPIGEIQARLMHSNASTTGIYVQRLRSAENKYADAIADMLDM